MGACVSQPEHDEEVSPPQRSDGKEEVMVSRTHTGSLSAFAAAAVQLYNEPDTPPALSLQPAQTRAAQIQHSHSAPQAPTGLLHTHCQELGRAVTALQIAPAAARTSPWVSMDAPATLSTVNAPTPLTVAAAARLRPESALWSAPSKEEHRAQLVQLLEDACRDQCVDWKAIRCSLHKARSADAPDVNVLLPAQNLMRNTPSTSLLRMVSSGRHDSASSSIESRRIPVPASQRTPKVPVLGKMGTAGSLPVYSYTKPAPEPSCPEFLRMLSVEGRTAYAHWRGENDSCRSEDLNTACDAAISSLSTMSCRSWLEIDMSCGTQSLFYGEDSFVKSPFENKIPAHIQRSLSSPSDPQLAMPQPGKMRGHRAPAKQSRSLKPVTDHSSDMGLLLERAHRRKSILANKFRDVHRQVDSGRRQSLDSDTSFYQNPLDGRLMRPPRTSSAGPGLSARPPLPRQASGY